jgi:hypothetical protein
MLQIGLVVVLRESFLVTSVMHDLISRIQMQEDLGSSKQSIDRFQAESSGLWVDKVYDRNEAGVENAEVNVGLVPDSPDGNGSDLDHQECEL